ncbi:b(0,+)-type amino acid transporter 1-like [Dreissena polymorpha]|uniref:Uncharacterized protein n=1 Tax=Dreissena polymorpha TaxID=45954 RepID=A0A9D4NEL9_DREPO|nr:b(0,+)-type amino acid transporter 1-like [Dreissena polymorpha]KAH3891837.1 hypothetical protein DPMN_015945 [Dreissena polymorpha]
MSIIIGLVYAELGVLLPKSGGDYSIIRSGLGDGPAFLFSWTSTVIMNSGGKALQALVFADYLCAFMFGQCNAPNNIRKSIAVVELLLIAITNTISVRYVNCLQSLFALLKIAALVVITAGGIVYLVQGKVDNFNNAFAGTTTDVTSISLAVYSCMWAYAGYTNLNVIVEEVVNPKKNVPRAFIIAIALVTAIYSSTNVAYFAVLTKIEFLAVPAVAFAWGKRVLGAGAMFIPISVMCSVYGASTVGFFVDIRQLFAAARVGHLPEVLSFLHFKSRIPLVALVLNTIFSIILVIPADVDQLLNMLSFIGFVWQALNIITLMKLRYQRRGLPRSNDAFSVPLVVPVLALLIILFMLISPFISNPKIEFVYGAGFVLSGLIVYVPFVVFKLKLPGWDFVTMYSQLFLEVCPTVLHEDI